MPSHNSTNELADRFQTYFTEKISIIREAISTSVETSLKSSKGDTILDKFESATEYEIREIITNNTQADTIKNAVNFHQTSKFNGILFQFNRVSTYTSAYQGIILIQGY